MVELRDEDCTDAEPIFEKLRDEFPYSRYAALGELRLADCEFVKEEWGSAVSAYRSFIRRRPAHDEVPYAHYRIASAHYQQIPRGWVITPATHERDQRPVRDALSALRRFIETYPESKHATEVNEMLQEVLGFLVDHEVDIAKFYRRRDAHRGAANRLELVLETYPDSERIPEVMFLLGDIYERQQKIGDAKRIFRDLVASYPKSEYATDAKKRL